jgi:hypothetical protein
MVGILVFAAGCACGAIFSLRNVTSKVEASQAIEELQSDLMADQYVEAHRYDELLQLQDVRINMHITKLRNAMPALAPNELAGMRATLNDVGNLWARRAPFTGPDFTQSEGASWYSEWHAEYQKNLLLVKSAEAECLRVQCSAIKR